MAKRCTMNKEVVYILGAVVVVILGGVLFSTTPGVENEVTGFSAFEEMFDDQVNYLNACYQCQDGTQVCDSETICRNEKQLYVIGETFCNGHGGLEMFDSSGAC